MNSRCLRPLSKLALSITIHDWYTYTLPGLPLCSVQSALFPLMIRELNDRTSSPRSEPLSCLRRKAHLKVTNTGIELQSLKSKLCESFPANIYMDVCIDRAESLSPNFLFSVTRKRNELSGPHCAIHSTHRWHSRRYSNLSHGLTYTSMGKVGI